MLSDPWELWTDAHARPGIPILPSEQDCTTRKSLMWGEHKRGEQEKAALPSLNFNRCLGPAMLHYSLDLCSPINTIHSIKFSFSVLKGEEEEKNHIPSIWHNELPQLSSGNKKGGKKRLVTTQFKITRLCWLHSVSGVDPSLSPHPLGLQAQSTWHSSGEGKQLQGNGRGKGRVPPWAGVEKGRKWNNLQKSHNIRRVCKSSASEDHHTQMNHLGVVAAEHKAGR